MEKFKILIPLRDYKYYQDISPALNYLDKEKYEIIFISYEELDNIENLYAVEKHFKNIERKQKAILLIVQSVQKCIDVIQDTFLKLNLKMNY